MNAFTQKPNVSDVCTQSQKRVNFQQDRQQASRAHERSSVGSFEAVFARATTRGSEMNDTDDFAGLPIDMIETGPTWRDVFMSIFQIVIIVNLGILLVMGAAVVMTMILATDLVGG